MKAYSYSLQVLILFGFLCHSYILITPVIDELGFFRVAIHVLLISVSWMLYLVARDINREENKSKRKKKSIEQKNERGVNEK